MKPNLTDPGKVVITIATTGGLHGKEANPALPEVTGPPAQAQDKPVVVPILSCPFGCGVVAGNTIFGNPNDAASWVFGMPSIWAWQILWWALGVGMMWFLAYKMELSLVPSKEVTALVEDIGDKQVA